MPDSESTLPNRSSESIPGVCEVFRLGGPRPASLLIEVPHGATELVHYDAVAVKLESPLPPNLEQFFHVNTDFGAPELAVAVARRVATAKQKARTGGVVVVRALVPRTFVDLNREIGETVTAGMTPGLPPYITAPTDRDLLLSLYQQYHGAVSKLYREVLGKESGLAVALHTFAPRSVEVAVDADIVGALRAAYRPAVFPGWTLRPGVDFITADDTGTDLSPRGLVASLRAAYSDLGVSSGENATYHLHPATMGYRYAAAWPGRTLCVEFRRDLLGSPWRPFVASAAGPRKVARLAAPLAAALSRTLTAG
ncbi:MAG: N-formylglutamate amidohydrolase [Thermoanaerobaculia bacterium]